MNEISMISSEIKDMRKKNQMMSIKLVEVDRGEDEEKKEIIGISKKIEDARMMKEMLLSTIETKNNEKRVQRQIYRKILSDAERYTNIIKTSGISNEDLYKSYQTLSKQKEELVNKNEEFGKKLTFKAKSKIMVIDGFKRLNKELIGQINRQRDILIDQQNYVKHFTEKENELKIKREEVQKKYKNDLKQLKYAYELRSTKAEIELLEIQEQESRIEAIKRLQKEKEKKEQDDKLILDTKNKQKEKQTDHTTFSHNSNLFHKGKQPK